MARSESSPKTILLLSILLLLSLYLISRYSFFEKTNTSFSPSVAPSITQKLTPTPFPTPFPLSKIDMQNWKTFTDDNYSYQYPHEWSSPRGETSTSFGIYKNTIMGLECGDLVEGSTKLVAGLNGKYAIWKDTDCGREKESQIFLSLYKGKDHYAFVFIFSSGEEMVAKQIFFKILDSFKFNR